MKNGSSALTRIVWFKSIFYFPGSSAFVGSSALAQKIVCFRLKDRLLSSGSSAFDRTHSAVHEFQFKNLNQFNGPGIPGPQS